MLEEETNDNAKTKFDQVVTLFSAMILQMVESA